MTLRPYQTAAIAGVLAAFRAGHRSTLVVAATGTGKTVMFTGLCGLAKKPVLVLAHTRQLVDQTARRLAESGLDVGVEMAERTSAAHVTVASVQSLGKRLERFAPDQFGLIVVDEAHRAVNYKRILEYFATAKLCGVTATPDRTDGKPLGQVFESVAHVYPIRQAIKDGWLAPLKVQTVIVDDLTLANVSGKADFDEDDLSKQLCVESALHAVAEPLVKLAGPRPTIVFCATVAHARAIETVMERYAPGRCVSVVGEDKDPEARIATFRNGSRQFLLNVAMLTEGFDAPEIACVAMARPTKSRSLATQCIGRGLRLAAGKADCLVLDFVSEDAVDLIGPADVLGGGEGVAAEMRKKAGQVDVLLEIPAVEQYLAEEERKRLIVAAEYRVLDAGALSPFSILGVVTPSESYAGAPPSPAQMEALAKHCTAAEIKGLDRGQAEVLLDGIRARARNGLCSLKQAKKLLRFGLNPDVSYSVAGEAMALLLAEGWRRCPAKLRNDPRFRVAPR